MPAYYKRTGRLFVEIVREEQRIKLCRKLRETFKSHESTRKEKERNLW